jgi:hypothetical protein
MTEDTVFTLRQNKEGLISLKKLFVDLTIDDPSEAVFALTLFDDVGYWMKVREFKLLKDHLEEWRKEADILRKSKAFQTMADEITNNGKSAYSAAKFFIDEPWKDKRNSKTNKAVKETTAKARKGFKVSDELDELIQSNRVN